MLEQAIRDKQRLIYKKQTETAELKKGLLRTNDVTQNVKSLIVLHDQSEAEPRNHNGLI